ncbi:MAG: hypothetical protein GY801_49290, partial [bacterium]|nr:hypothetical protein [bacterium]
RFGREFNKWFSAQGDAEEQFTEPIDIQLVLQELRQLVREPPVPPPPKVKRPFRKLLQTEQEEVDTSRFRRWIILANVVLLLTVSGGVWYWWPDAPVQLPEPRPPARQKIEPQEQIPTFDRKRLYQNVPYIKTVTYTPLLNPKNWLQNSGLERWKAPYDTPVQVIEISGSLTANPPVAEASGMEKNVGLSLRVSKDRYYAGKSLLVEVFSHQNGKISAPLSSIVPPIMSNTGDEVLYEIPNTPTGVYDIAIEDNSSKAVLAVLADYIVEAPEQFDAGKLFYQPPVPLYSGYFAVGLLSVGIVYGFAIWRSRKIPEDRAPPCDSEKDRRFFLGRIGGSAQPRLDNETLNHLADSMGYFQSRQAGTVLNVPASIQATLE